MVGTISFLILTFSLMQYLVILGGAVVDGNGSAVAEIRSRRYIKIKGVGDRCTGPDRIDPVNQNPPLGT